METIAARLDTEGLDLYGRLTKQNRSAAVRELVETGKKQRALELYQEKKVSLGLGAELAGVCVSEFLDLLVERGVQLNLALEDAMAALGTARKILKKIR